MRLVTRIFPSTTKLSLVKPAGVAVWVVALIVVETIGRRSTSELTDAVMLLAIALLALLMLNVPRPAGWKISMVFLPLLSFAMAWTICDFLLKRLSRWRVRIGADFRRSPPVTKKFPPAWLCFLLSVCLIVVSVLLLSWFFPELGLRAKLAPYFYLGWLVCVICLWTLLVLATVANALVAWAVIHDRCVERRSQTGQRSLLTEVAIVSGATALIALGYAVLDIRSTVLVYAGLFAGFSITCVSIKPGLHILWHYRNESDVFSFDWRGLAWMYAAGVGSVTIVLVVLALGTSIVNGRAETAEVSITAVLGQLLAWSGVACMTGCWVVVLRYWWLAFMFQSQPGTGSSTDRHDDQDDFRIRRRRQIAARRELRRGLQKLLKQLPRRSKRPGMGIWFSPMYWFSLGLSYDEPGLRSLRNQKLIDEFVGTPYHRAFTHAARSHLWEVTTAVEIDLIFVEHSVSARRFLKVLRQMFEVYDIFGGRQRAEERHFHGLPGVQVIIHEYDFVNPQQHQQHGYREPSYEELARARILHICRDYGNREERIFPIDDSELTPIPARMSV